MLNGNSILQPEMFIKIDIGPLFVFAGGIQYLFRVRLWLPAAICWIVCETWEKSEHRILARNSSCTVVVVFSSCVFIRFIASGCRTPGFGMQWKSCLPKTCYKCHERRCYTVETRIATLLPRKLFPQLKYLSSACYGSCWAFAASTFTIFCGFTC